MYRKKEPPSLPVMPDGLLYTLVLLSAGGIISIWSWKIAIFLMIPILFVLFFFRNPRRKIIASEGEILSPADGGIMSVTQGDDEIIGPDSVTITIFLSLFDVHINRSPVNGRVFHHNYREGAMLPAFKSHASEINERNTIGIVTPDGKKVLVRQITGFIARRIVWWVDIDSILNKGEKFGFIKFGSCTQLVLPKGTYISAEAGQKVRAGETVLGVMK